MANKEYTPLRQRLRADTADSKLLFVGFALLIMVIGPIITGALININEQELLASVDRAEQQVQALRSSAQSGGLNSSAASGQSRASQAAFDNALREQEHAKATINALHDIQDCVIAVFGLLGLVAAFYSRRALQDTRATLRELDAERAKLAVAYDTTREGERRFRDLAEMDARRARALESLFETAGHLSVSASPREMREYLTRHVARVLQASRVTLWSYDSALNLLSPLLPSWGFEDAQLASADVAVVPGEWAHGLLFGNATIRSNDVASESDGALYEQLRALNVGSVLAVPLIAHGQPVGILCACDKQEASSSTPEFGGGSTSGQDMPGQDTSTQSIPGQNTSRQGNAGRESSLPARPSREEFTDEDVRVLRTFAGQAAFVLHSARQYAIARARSEELAALARLTRVLVNSLELEAIVPAFLGEARALVPYGRARLALLPPVVTSDGWSQEYPEYDEAETDLLRRLRGKSAPNAQAAVQLWSVEWPFHNAALPARLPAQTLTLAPDDRLRHTLQTAQGRQHSDQEDGQAQSGEIILIPIVAQGRLMGVVEFEEAEPDKVKENNLQEGKSERFGENHFVLAQQAVDQFAAAAQNAQSFAEATRRAEQLQWAIEETHHRIKNNLQAVISILDIYRMEVEDAGGKNSAPAQKEAVAQEGIAHAMREVRTIAAVHELLSEDIHNSRVNARHMLDSLIPLLLTASVTAGKRVQTDIEAQDITLPSKLVSALALAANELIVNGVRHGGVGREELRLRVELKRLWDEVILTVSDDGQGFAPGFDPQKNAKIGLGLTRTLIERDFKGKLTFANQGEGGAIVTAAVPYQGE